MNTRSIAGLLLTTSLLLPASTWADKVDLIEMTMPDGTHQKGILQDGKFTPLQQTPVPVAPLTTNLQVATPQVTKIRLPLNSLVELRVTEAVEKKHHDGDVIQLVVTKDVVGLDNKTVFIKAGTPAYAILSESKNVSGFTLGSPVSGILAGRLRKDSTLTLVPHHVTLTNGETIMLLGKVASTDERASAGWRAASVVPVVGILALPGLIASKHANRAHIAQDTIIQTFTAQDAWMAAPMPVVSTTSTIPVPPAQPAIAP